MLGRRQQLEVLRRCEERLRRDRVDALEFLAGGPQTLAARRILQDEPTRLPSAGRNGAGERGSPGSSIAESSRREPGVDPARRDEADGTVRAEVRRRRRRLARAGRALRSTSSRLTGGSRPRGGSAGGGDLAELLLRAYDDAAAACGRDLRGIGLSAALERLERSVGVIDRIGSSLAVRIAPAYHALRRRELELAAGTLPPGRRAAAREASPQAPSQRGPRDG
ncbi:hypothetical protein UA75_14000 [Actinoalloteichus sp. GBA129-24]|nr:hypothetical protein UA75_14000 [Actinoalloteichus sp. GBA129-24]